MRLVLQRVANARVSVGGEVVGSIGRGLLALVGVQRDDGAATVERAVEKLKDGSLVVEGTVSAADLREKHHVPLPESEDFATVAGFVLARLGNLPKGGEVVAAGDYLLTVVDVERNRISKVKIERRPGAAAVGPAS